MKKYIYTFCLTFFFAGALFSKESNFGQLVDKIVAEVNNDVILYSEIEAKKRELARKKIKAPFEEQALKSNKAALDILINDLLIEQSIKEKDFWASASEVDQAFQDNLNRLKMTEEQFVKAISEDGHTVKDYKKRLKNELSVRRLFGSQIAKASDTIKDKDIQNFYITHHRLFSGSKRYHAKQIFFKSKGGPDKAREVLALLKKGEDFETLAKKYSEGPEAESGGDLGVLEIGQMIPEFEKQIKDLPLNQPSPVFETEIGLHIIKIDLPQELKEQIHERLFQEEILKIQQNFIQKRREESSIKVFI